MTADKNSNTSAEVYPETTEAVERWQQGKINIFDEMARLERERNEARAECLEQARLLGMSADREEKLRVALRGLIFFAEEDQHLAAPAYRKAFLRAQEALK